VKRKEKEDKVSELAEKLKKAKSIFFTEFSGLNVEAMTSLRKRFREASVEFRVVKNSLARLAAAKAGLETLVDHFNGPTALAIGEQDPVLPAKILTEFIKETDLSQIKAALFEEAILDGKEAQRIATLPSREILLSQLVCGLWMSLYNLAYVLKAPLRKLLSTLELIEERKKAKGGF